MLYELPACQWGISLFGGEGAGQVGGGGGGGHVMRVFYFSGLHKFAFVKYLPLVYVQLSKRPNISF